MDPDALIDTQTPPDYLHVGSQEVLKPKPAWGRLYSTTIYLKPVDLEKPSFVLGRAENCDVVLSKQNFFTNSLGTISKTHFKIHRSEETIYITDLSKNGTFINTEKIGKGKTVILPNDAQIAIGTQQLGVYVYKTIGSEDLYLPPELRCKYEISRKLGTGTYGEVRLVFEKKTCKEFAVKRISKTSMDGSNLPERMKSEINILKSLSHPCIVSMKEITETEEAVFLILEYMNGGDLQDYINGSDGLLPEVKVKLIFYQIFVGVQYLHSQGITHRDLKPGNILLKATGSAPLVKISDFGLSRMINSSASMHTLCGTPYYIAPEIIDECSSYTNKVDIWSLGVMLFLMLSKELPFKSYGSGHQKLFTQIKTGQYSMNENIWKFISKNAKDLVSQMLTINPKERIEIADIIKHPWISADEDMQRSVKLLMDKETLDIVSNSDSSDFSDIAIKKPRLDC